MRSREADTTAGDGSRPPPLARAGGLCSFATGSSQRRTSRPRSSSSAPRGCASARSSSSAGLVTRTQVARGLAEQHELPFIELAESDLQIEAATLLPEDLARRYTALPVSIEPDGSLLVAVADPTNVLHSDELRLALGVPLRFGVAAPDAIDAAIAFIHQQVLTLVDEDEDEAAAAALGVHDVEDGEAETPAVSQVNKTIQRALSLGASDIHFTPQPRGLVVRGRVDGVVRELATIPTSQQSAVTSRLKVMGRLDIAERRAPQDGRVAVKAGARPVDLRMAVLPTKFGEKVTLRVLNQAAAPSSLAELAMAPDLEEIVRKAIHQPYGAILTCGPTGQRQDDDALRGAPGAEHARPHDHDDRGSRRVRHARASTRSRSTSAPG